MIEPKKQSEYIFIAIVNNETLRLSKNVNVPVGATSN